MGVLQLQQVETTALVALVVDEDTVDCLHGEMVQRKALTVSTERRQYHTPCFADISMLRLQQLCPAPLSAVESS